MPEGLYISGGNDVISYFQSAANRTSVLILGHVQLEISRFIFSETSWAGIFKTDQHVADICSGNYHQSLANTGLPKIANLVGNTKRDVEVCLSRLSAALCIVAKRCKISSECA